MLKEKNPLLKLNLKEEKYELSGLISNIYDSFYTLFNTILEDPIENFWYECISIIISYTQILLYLIDKTVSD